MTKDPSEPVHTVWSPDGLRIAYTDFVTGSFIMSAETAWEDQSVVVLPRLTDRAEIFAAFSWSPDGNWLAGFGYDETRTPDETGIYVYSFESGQYEKLTESGSYPRWLTTDSRTLVYADRGTIYVVDRAIQRNSGGAVVWARKYVVFAGAFPRQPHPVLCLPISTGSRRLAHQPARRIPVGRTWLGK